MTQFRSHIFRRLTLWLSLSAILVATHVQGQTHTHAEAAPYWPTNSYWTALEINPALYGSTYSVNLFTPTNGEDGARVWSQTKSMLFYGAGVALFLAALPESATGWETETDIFSKWVENVKAGPRWDRDNWAYNYLGHAYVGGVYYQVARKSGYRQWDSFIYTTLMSTFFWEYGIEAFAEVPSIQDLIFTPLAGWVYGEWSYQTELRIRDRNNEVAGSKILGETSLFFLDPIDSLGRGINRVVGRRWVKSGTGYFTYVPAPYETSSGTDTDHTVYLNMKFPLGGSPQPYEPQPIRYNHYDDPVDTGIVGISLGGGHTILDDKWGIEDGAFKKITMALYFTPRFSTRFSYAWADLEDAATGTSVEYENYSLDAQYYFNIQRKVRPYVSAGVGELMWNKSEDEKVFQLNLGLGLHWQAFKKWAVQADWKNYASTDTETYDQNFSASLIYRFGRGEHNNW